MARLHRPDKNLLTRYFKGEGTAEEVALIELYLALDVDQEFVKQCLKEAQNGFEDDPVLHLNQTKLDGAWEEFQSRKYHIDRYTHTRSYWKYAIAAAVAALCISIATIYFERHATLNKQSQFVAGTSYQEIEAPKGRLKKITLPDGSTVTLFPGSSIRYPNNYNLRDRSLRLTGRAYFDVKAAENKPFYVCSGELTTRVLGTTFEINAPAGINKQTVTLNTGKVSVQYGANELGSLAPNEQMTICSASDFFIRKINTARRIAWVQKQLIYEQIPLADICAELECWYDIKITISQSALKSKKLTASFTKQPLNVVLDILSRTGAFKYKTGNREVVIY
jgi:transmembrane sensor